MKYDSYYLGELVSFTKGCAFKTSVFKKSGIPIIKVGNLNSGLDKIGEWVYLDENEYDNYKKYVVMENDAIISTVGSWPTNPASVVGKCCIIPKKNAGNLLNQNSVIIRTNSEKLLQKYLDYLLLDKKFNNYIVGCAQGSASQASITLKDISKYKVDIPPIDYQKKIIYILENIDYKIEKNNEISDSLQELIKLIFDKWFVKYDYPNFNRKYVESNLGEIPENWKTGKLSDIVDFINGYGFNAKTMIDHYEPDTYKVFKQASIKIGGGFYKDKTKSWCKKSNCTGLDKFVSKKGDVLMCMTDMKASLNPLLGHTALMDVDNEYIINQRVGILRAKSETTDYPFIYTLSNSSNFINRLRSRANSGVQVNLSTQGICDTEIVIPDEKTMKIFNNIASNMYEKIFSLTKQNNSLDALKGILLPRLLSGEIDLKGIRT